MMYNMVLCPRCGKPILLPPTTIVDKQAGDRICNSCGLAYEPMGPLEHLLRTEEELASAGKARVCVRLKSMLELKLLRQLFEEAAVSPMHELAASITSNDMCWQSPPDFLSLIELMREEAVAAGLDCEV